MTTILEENKRENVSMKERKKWRIKKEVILIYYYSVLIVAADEIFNAMSIILSWRKSSIHLFERKRQKAEMKRRNIQPRRNDNDKYSIIRMAKKKKCSVTILKVTL